MFEIADTCFNTNQGFRIQLLCLISWFRASPYEGYIKPCCNCDINLVSCNLREPPWRDREYILCERVLCSSLGVMMACFSELHNQMQILRENLVFLFFTFNLSIILMIVCEVFGVKL